MIDLPEDLVSSIRAGRCVAFVGAGFTAAEGLPSWRDLLVRVTDSVEDPKIKAYAHRKLDGGSSDANEEVAQILEQALTRDRFSELLRAQLPSEPKRPAMRRRLELLRGIPFHAVLTTNFDGILSGQVAGPDAYRTILEPPRTVRSLFAEAMEARSARWRAPVVKLHGDVNVPESVVLSRLDYRRRLYGDSAYLGFLRSVFLFDTVVYLGFSFTDAYINQLRSETLAMLGRAPADRPRSYAVINDVPPVAHRHLREVEGIQVLTYDTDGGRDFSGFDRLLEQIHDATNHLVHFGTLLDGKRILWVDPNPGSFGAVAEDVFDQAARKAGRPRCVVEYARDADDAIRKLPPSAGYDLVVSHWGQDAPGGPTAVQILKHIRAHDVPVPLMVFASGDYADENKRNLLRRGGIGFYHSWDGLLGGFEHVFAPGSVSG